MTMKAADTGWELGVVASTSVKGSDSQSDESNYITYGLETAFRWQLPIPLPVKLYLRPELELQCLRYNYMSYGSYNFYHDHSSYFSTDLGLGMGVNLYKGLNFYTGPQFRYAIAGENSSFGHELHNKITSYWSFGIYWQIFKAYINLKYCQHLTKGSMPNLVVGGYNPPSNFEHNPYYSNKFKLSVGYRF